MENQWRRKFCEGCSYSIFLIGTFLSASCLTMPCSSRAVRISNASPPCWNLVDRAKILHVNSSSARVYRAVRPTRWMYVFASGGQSNCTTQLMDGKSKETYSTECLLIHWNYLIHARQYLWRRDRQIVSDRMYHRWTFVSFDPLCRRVPRPVFQDEVCKQHRRETSPMQTKRTSISV